MARVIEAVQIFKKVEDVTSAKDDPSPVYIMDELADMARASVDSSEKIADRIAKRLQNKSPVAKYKALRLIRHLVNKGCGHFQRFMQRHAELVRGHVNFKGEPDPYKGDTPNQRVRDSAKDAAEALFNTVMAQPVNGLGSRIQGFGSSAVPASSSAHNGAHSAHGNTSFSGGAVASAASGSRMVGFGNGTYNAPSAGASNANGSTAGGGSFGGFGFGQKGVNRPLTGGYGAEAGGPTSSGGHGGGGYTAPPVAAVEVLGSEDQLVDSICTPGGLRLAPDPEDLRRFVEAVGSLDGLKVAELLRDKMDASGPWQQQLRALYALEAVLLQGASQACGEVAVMFQSDPGPVQAAEAHAQAAVRERSGRVLKLLLGDAAAPAAAPAPAAARPVAQAPTVAPAAAQQAPVVDLLGGLDTLSGPPLPSGQPTQQQQYAVPSTAPGDLFSGLAVPAGQSAPQQGYGEPAPQAAAASHTPHLGGYGQQPVIRQQQQPQPGYPQQPAPSFQASVRAGPLDPFEPLSSSAATPISSMQPGRPAYQQPPPQQQPPYQQVQPPPQQQPYQQQWHQHQAHALPAGSGGPQAPVAGPAGPSYNATSRPAAQAMPPRHPGAPLDDIFADMSLSGGTAVASTSATAGVYGAGGGFGGGGPHGPAGPTYGGYGIGGPQGSGPQAQPGLSGVGTPLGIGAQYGGPPPRPPQQYPGNGAMGPGPASHVAMPQQQQQPVPRVPVPVASSGHADFLGAGYDLLGTGAPPSGPSDGVAGPAAWPGLGGAGYGATGAPGPSGLGFMPGGIGGAPGGMMVGPGGQVRYVGGEGAGQGAGAGIPGASWQHQPYGTPKHQPYGGMGGVGLSQQQQQQTHYQAAVGTQKQQQQGGAAFNFVMDHFTK